MGKPKTEKEPKEMNPEPKKEFKMADVKQENQGSSNQYCKIMSNALTRKSYNVFLMDEICEPHNYVDLFNILKTVDEDDEINIFINSPGVDTFQLLYRSL